MQCVDRGVGFFEAWVSVFDDVLNRKNRQSILASAGATECGPVCIQNSRDATLKGVWNIAWGKCGRFRDKRRPSTGCMVCLYLKWGVKLLFPCPFRPFLITMPISWAVGPG